MTASAPSASRSSGSSAALSVAAGAVLYWRGHVAHQREERLTVHPVITPELAGLAILGRY